MEPFTLPLSNDSMVAGICNLPAPSAFDHKSRPLVVGIHGGTYDCHYFDANDKHSASRVSRALGIPFVAIDRPCYGRTGSFLPVPEGSTFEAETGKWLHCYILPALWAKFGVPNGCNSIVLLCHSFGVMGGLAAAAMHAQDQAPSYPLAGVVMSGIGSRSLPQPKRDNENSVNEARNSTEGMVMPPKVKDFLMMPTGTVDPDVLALTEQLNQPTPFAEMESFFPWMLTCPRIDLSLVQGAPHCMELSYWSQGWYSRCFGFALECSTSFAARP
ncbi:hypothetical protein C8A03DRAFT_44211 [Achaetomium macrosporum]|uniref:AB hydrolase-1 domain-containing protein n=1 Tax=Achaetomium macrosporum TaxID=79813 RepID=A0AAN7H6Y2_9PEZI|nr:hypothetical protein C8A03DRAFT_44211 [Achaetomium macrosporum]